jgi:phosphonate transport system substrate-binding protein
MQPKNSPDARWIRNVAKLAKYWPVLLIPVILIAMLLFLEDDHEQGEDIVAVSLDRTSTVPPVQVTNTPSSNAADASLRAAIAGVLSPTKSLEYYEELLTYLGQEIDRQLILFQKPTYAEVNDLINGQRVDLAFICSLAYVKGKRDFDMELLVAPQIDGKTVYYSYLIVPEASTATSLMDLEGVSFAFTDPLSNSGHLAPTYQLSLLNTTPASFFEKYVFTYSHDSSITAVANKLVDAAAVDSLVYDLMVAGDAELASKTKAIARWGPYGIPPVAINPELEPQLKQQLREFFLNLHTSSKGVELLNNLGIDKFITVNDDIYDSIREMETKLGR